MLRVDRADKRQKVNKEKVAHTAKMIMVGLAQRQFTADETVALLKCLDKITRSRCIDEELVVTTKKQILEVLDGRKNINQLGG